MAVEKTWVTPTLVRAVRQAEKASREDEKGKARSWAATATDAVRQGDPKELAGLVHRLVAQFSNNADGDLTLHRYPLSVVVRAFDRSARALLDSGNPDRQAMQYLVDCDDRLTVAASMLDIKYDHTLGARLQPIAYPRSERVPT